MSVYLEPAPGSHLDEAIQVARDVVRLTGVECVVIFNDRILRAGFKTTKADLLLQWSDGGKP